MSSNAISDDVMKAIQEKTALVKKLTQAKAQLAQRNTILRRSELTLKELEPIEDTAVTYRSVGRMFIHDNLPAVKEEIKGIIASETVEIETLTKAIATLETHVASAERDIRELMATVAAK